MLDRGLLFTFHTLNLTTTEAQAAFLRASGTSDAQQPLVREHVARVRQVLPDTITFGQLTVEWSRLTVLGPP